MNGQNKGKLFFRSLAPFFAAILMQNGIAFFLMQGKMIIDMASTDKSYFYALQESVNGMVSPDFTTLISLVYSIFAVVIFGLWYMKTYRDYKGTDLSLKGYSPIIIVGILCFAFGGQVFCNYLVEVIGKLFPTLLTNYLELLENAGLNEEIGIPMLIYAVILGPISEELIFRGLTYGKMRDSFSFWTANILQAVLFAVFHMNPMQAIYVFLMGLALGYIMEKTGNIIVTIICHIAYNGISIVVGMLLERVPEMPVVTFAFILGSLVLCYIGLKLVVKAVPEKKQAEGIK